MIPFIKNKRLNLVLTIYIGILTVLFLTGMFLGGFDHTLTQIASWLSIFLWLFAVAWLLVKLIDWIDEGNDT